VNDQGGQEGGWDGVGVPRDGDFLRPRPAGNVHIAVSVYPLLSGAHAQVVMACGKKWTTHVLDPAGDRSKQCQACWDAM
jgi:hypothetical protein